MSYFARATVDELLWERLDDIRQHAKGKLPWKHLVDDPLPSTPWKSWTLLALVQHQERQELVAETVQRLNVDLSVFDLPDALRRLGVPPEGVTPDFLEWKYCFHGKGCCLTDPESGEVIDVDFHHGSSEWIDTSHFSKCMDSLQSPPFVEERFKALHSSFESVQLSIDKLVDSELLHRLGDRSVVSLNFDYEWLHDTLIAIETQWNRKSIRRAVAAAVGDWFLLKELVSQESPMYAAIQELAASCRA